MKQLAAAVLSVMVMLPGLSRADCSGGAVALGRSCSGIDFQGCCDGEKLLFCEAGEVCQKDCEKAQHCGFSADKGFYDCGTDGMADPSGAFAMECPSDPCGGIGYQGCCAGSTVLWCENGTVKSLDCSLNGSKSMCGASTGSAGAADCVVPGSAAAPSCSVEPGSDILPGDVVLGDVAAQEDVAVDYDGIAVPDMNAPTECASLERYWAVSSTTCPVFADTTQVKQDGCVAVYAGLAPTAEWYPYGRVTVSGIQMSFMEAGVKHQCSAQFAGETLQGQCFWGDSQCVFTLAPTEAPTNPDNPTPEPSKKSSGGCAASSNASFGSLWLMVALLTLLAAGRTLRRN